MNSANKSAPYDHEDGYMLLAVVVMVALVLIALAIAAPVVARDLRREKEVESERRARQYVRAIELYQRKFKNQYPPSIKALEGTNNIRYLRQQYIDPLTGQADWRLIHQGEQKTKIHYIGKELNELVLGLSAAPTIAGASSVGTPAVPAQTVNSTNALNSGFGGATISGTAGTTGTGAASNTSGSTSSSTSAADATLGVIVGVGPARSGSSILTPEGQADYSAWEFWWDPRIALLKASAPPTGGGVGGGSLGSNNATTFNGTTGNGTNSNGINSNGTTGNPAGTTGNGGSTPH